MRKWLQKRLRLQHQSPHLPSQSSRMEFIARSCLRSSWQDSTRVLTSRKRRWWCLSSNLWIPSNYCFTKNPCQSRSVCVNAQSKARRRQFQIASILIPNGHWLDVSGLESNLIFHVARSMSWLSESGSKNSWNYLGSSEISDQVKSIKIQYSQNLTSWWTVDFLCSFLASVLGLKDHSYKARNGIIIDYFSGFLLYRVHPLFSFELQVTSISWSRFGKLNYYNTESTPTKWSVAVLIFDQYGI